LSMSLILCAWVRVTVFKDTFNNMSVLSNIMYVFLLSCLLRELTASLVVIMVHTIGST
jgi:hypothetical protein